MESDNSLILNLGLHDVVHSMLSPILSDNNRIKLNTKQQTTTHHLVLQHQGGSLKQNRYLLYEDKLCKWTSYISADPQIIATKAWNNGD